MDHGEAVQSHTTERYLLGELKDRARDEFEDHFFECADCAEAVRTGLLFMDNAAAEVRGTGAQVADRADAPQKPFWTKWFHLEWRQPAFAFPALAALAVSGLWLTDHARLQNELASATAPQAFSDVPLDVSRGKHSATVIRQNHFFAVSFYIDPDTLPEYAVEISGDGVAPAAVQTPHVPNGRYNILLPSSRYKPGRYEITVKGTDGRFIQQFPLSIE